MKIGTKVEVQDELRGRLTGEIESLFGDEGGEVFVTVDNPVGFPYLVLAHISNVTVLPEAMDK